MLRFLSVLLFFSFLISCAPYRQYDLRDVRERWEKDIAEFDRLSEAGYPQNPVLFYGSSSIRLWEDIEADMAPLSVVRRGYGGAALHDAAYYAKRVFHPIDYRALVLFVANDIWGNEYDKSPDDMEELVDYIVKSSRKHRPDAPVFLIEVTQVPARAHLMAEWDAANDMLQAFAEARDYVHFIPTRDLYVNADETIKSELFRDDNVHQNEAGYRVWTDRIKYYLQRVLR